MDAEALNAQLQELVVRFVGGPPSEELLHLVRRYAARQPLPCPLTVVMRWHPDLKSMQEVRLEQPGHVLLREHDPDMMLAVRNAFDRLPTVPLAPSSLK